MHFVFVRNSKTVWQRNCNSVNQRIDFKNIGIGEHNWFNHTISFFKQVSHLQFFGCKRMLVFFDMPVDIILNMCTGNDTGMAVSSLCYSLYENTGLVLLSVISVAKIKRKFSLSSTKKIIGRNDVPQIG